MSTVDIVRRHYERNADSMGVVALVIEKLDALGDTPLTVAELAALDQFHVGGLEATARLAELVTISPQTKVLDAGSGLGGPSRYLAATFGCQVVGIDLTPSYVALSGLLAERTGLADRVRYETGDLLDLPFAAGEFDLVWTQHVVMNIADRERLYQEFRRVLKPKGKLAFYDAIAADGKPELLFPVPWAESKDASFLLTEAETIAALENARLKPCLWKDVTSDARTALGQQRTLLASGVSLVTVMGPRFPEMAANFAGNMMEGKVRLVMGVCDAV